jgi:hypothetical protein
MANVAKDTVSVVSGGISKRSADKDGTGSVASSRTATSVISEPKKRSFSSVSSKIPVQNQPAVSNTAAAVFLSPQSLLDHSHNDNNHLEDLLFNVGITPDRSATKKIVTHKEQQQQRSHSAPKPRPSPLTFALSTEETKQAAKQDMILLKTPSNKTEEHIDQVKYHNPALITPSPATKPTKPVSSASAKKSMQSQPSSGFTAEQLSAYKARKRAAMSSGSSGNMKSPASIARYAAPTVSAYIRGKEKEQQSSGKKPSLIPVSIKSNIKDNNSVVTRNVSPIRHVTVTIDEEKEQNMKNVKRDDRSVNSCGRNPVIMNQTTHLRRSSPMKFSKNIDRGSNEEKKDTNSFTYSFLSKRNSEGSSSSSSSEGYNESMNILNMTIEDSTFSSSPKTVELKVFLSILFSLFDWFLLAHFSSLFYSFLATKKF